MPTSSLTPAEEWVVFRDPVDPRWKWHFDVAFLASSYTCTFGTGCRGCAGAADVGACCGEGVHLVTAVDDDEGRRELARVQQVVPQLTADEWQNHGTPVEGCFVEDGEGEIKTRPIDGYCVFHNREGFAAGAGCAFHGAALRRGEDPLDWKPETCWLVPLQIEVDDEAKTKTIRAYHNYDDWGGGEDEPLDWWCVDDPVNYPQGGPPVFRSLQAELRRLTGDALYDALAVYLDEYLLARGGPGVTPVNFIGLLGVAPDGSTGRVG
jgi:hypothetical protein